MLDRLLADWPLKLLSVMVAFTLWASITGEDRAVRDVDLPLAVELRPEHLLAGAPPKTVTVRLEGPRTVVRAIDPVELAVRLDLHEAPTGEIDVLLTEGHLEGLPRRVDVTFFEPDRVRLSVGRRVRREINVEPGLVGQPPAGYALYDASVRPRKLTIEGPDEVVSGLSEIRTNPLRLDHRTRPFSETVSVVPEQPGVKVVDPRPIEVRVVIDEAPIERRFDEVPVRVARGRTGLTVRPETAEVVVTGPPALVERLAPQQIRLVVQATAGEPGRSSVVQVEAGVVDLADDERKRIAILSVRPETVTVVTTSRPEEEASK